MALALDNLQRLICHKTKKPNQSEIWVMWSTPSFPLHSGSHWHGVGASDKVLSMDQIEQLNCDNKRQIATVTSQYYAQKQHRAV